jgi:hypothetical protein
MRPGAVSVRIAQVLLVIQILLIVGMGGAGHSPTESKPVAFGDKHEMVESLTYLVLGNTLGIGALILSLITWKSQRNIRGRDTAIASVVVTVVNTIVLIAS